MSAAVPGEGIIVNLDILMPADWLEIGDGSRDDAEGVSALELAASCTPARSVGCLTRTIGGGNSAAPSTCSEDVIPLVTSRYVSLEVTLESLESWRQYAAEAANVFDPCE
jgi:hypothetical protein